MQDKTKRQIIEERRGIFRGPDGKIVLTDEQKLERAERFREKRVESEARASRCRHEEKVLREQLGAAPIQDDPIDDANAMIEALRAERDELKCELETLKASIKPGFWSRAWRRVRSLWNA